MKESPGHPTEFTRRLIDRQTQLGANVEERAHRSGIAASPRAMSPPNRVSLRLVPALGTTPATGGDIKSLPGIDGTHTPPQRELSRSECAEHLAPGGIGCLMFASKGGPVALLVAFAFVEGDIILRTRVDGSLEPTAGSNVRFEVDRTDKGLRDGWRVLVTGPARVVDEPSELARISQLGIGPWPCGRTKALIRIESREISGQGFPDNLDAA